MNTIQISDRNRPIRSFGHIHVINKCKRDPEKCTTNSNMFSSVFIYRIRYIYIKFLTNTREKQEQLGVEPVSSR